MNNQALRFNQKKSEQNLRASWREGGGLRFTPMGSPEGSVAEVAFLLAN